MKTFIGYVIPAVMLVASPSAAMAQRVPATYSSAIGGDAGLFMGRLSVRPTAEGFYEYYFLPRSSVRVGLGWARPEAGEQYLRVPVDLVYGGRGAVRPFAGAGIGIYFLQEKARFDDERRSETKMGGTVFGGAELFPSPTAAVKLEARYHAVRNTIGNPDGLTLSVGLKKYF